MYHMKNKKIIFLAFILSASFILSGCAQLKDKFIRKPKEEKVSTKRYYNVREYDVHPSLELYTKRYIFWKSWHKELLNVLSHSNHKKKVVAVEQEVSNLMEMRNMLVDEKSDELEKLMNEVVDIEKTIKKEKITSGNEVRIRRKLESLGKTIKRGFSYTKVREFIRDDFREE